MKKIKRYDDLDFNWFTREYGNDWRLWKDCIGEYANAQTSSLGPKLASLNAFVLNFLLPLDIDKEPSNFFKTLYSVDLLYNSLKGKAKREATTNYRYNIIVDFLDWLILKKLSEPDDYGTPTPLISNPYVKNNLGSTSNRLTETVYNPLPYTVIKELRSVLCPNEFGSFSDWHWAQSISEADWVDINPNYLDKEDPDCVYKTKGGRTLIWSPVRALIIFIKLHIPLRTYQVRMLDSGESDYWRYNNGNWEVNSRHSWAVKSENQCYRKSFFKKIKVSSLDEVMTGLYITTNKSADRNKNLVEHGYTIPWQHEVVLYWTEKIRNWQEKYNPIQSPTKFTDLSTNQIGLKKSNSALELMGESCFIMRHAAARRLIDRDKPTPPKTINILWYYLLDHLEKKYEERGEKSASGSTLRFVERRFKQGEPVRIETMFPLHSLRVSLLTCYGVEGGVPAPVLSKLIAGHSRVMMTVYYHKVLPNKMRDLLSEAEQKISDNADNDFQRFLEDAELESVMNSTHYIDARTIENTFQNRNPLSWERRLYGVCLAGGNTLPGNEQQSSSIAGCWNGGKPTSNDSSLTTPVPNGPENCIRCRWFITSALHLDALRAQFNSISYKASLAADLAVKLEGEVETIEDEKVHSLRADIPFTKADKLKQAENRLQKQTALANEYALDLNACFIAIGRIIDVESSRGDDDLMNKFISIGDRDDIDIAVNIEATNSELLQLFEICEDAEVYPELADDLNKTPAIHQRSDYLGMMMMKQGYTPPFMLMDSEMKLVMGNAMVREMAKSVSTDDWRNTGFKIVSGLIETGDTLSSNGILQQGINRLIDINKDSSMDLSINKRE